MSQWHRENPELVGTDADPWMANPLHASAHHELELEARGRRGLERSGYRSIEEAMEDSTHTCDPVNGCGQVQRGTPSNRCRYCGCELRVREP